MATPGPRPARHGRTWWERLAIAGTVVTAVLCFLAAGSLVAGYMVVRSRDIVEITNPADEAAAATTTPDAGPATTVAPGDTAAPATPTTTPETFPPSDPTASNFLLTGADNGACVDPDSPYAPAFGDEESGRVGERSDTIMIMRVDPAAKRVAVLSFPRDLYVTIAGSGNRARINSAYRRDDPQRLIDTIYENFGIGTDHFIQVDFCTFKTLVDAVGGVTVPFEFAARDPNSGLNVPGPGCFTFDGDHALAYVRSRHYEYEDPPGSGDWREDPSSDLGRISRQQDFLRRSLTSILNKGLLNPSVASGLISAATGGDVVTSSELSLAKLMEFAGVLRDVEAASIPSYQIEAVPRNVGGDSVLEPRIQGDNMQAVLAMFRGESSLADAPVQSFEPTTTPATRPGTPEDTAPATTPPAATNPPQGSGPAEINVGIVPPRDVQCP
jgi:LCP family protein required for cell wall assembly